MATNKQLKFFKGASAPAAPAAGMIWFCTSDRTIRVYTGEDWEKYAGLVDANWNNTDKLLTITSANGSTTTLNLSDMASASGVAAQIQTINTNISNAQNAADAAQADVDAVEEKLGDGFSKNSTVTAQLAAVKTTADAAAVKATVDAALELKADKTQVTADIAAAKSGAEATAAADATSKANQALADAKTYVDGKDAAMDARVDALEAAIGTGGSVDSAITAKIEDLDATVGSTTVAEGKHVAVEVVETDGKLTTLTVTESDIASAQALADEVSRATAAEQDLNSAINGVSEKVTKLIGEDSDMSAREIVQDEVAKQLTSENISESFDTLKEMAEWLSSHPADVKEITDDIAALEGLVGSTSVQAQITAAIEGLSDEAKSSEDANLVKVTVSQADGNVTGVSLDDSKLDQTIVDINGQISANTAAHEANAAAIKTINETTIPGINGRLDDLDDDVERIDGVLATLATSDSMTQLTNRVSANEAAIERLDSEQATQNQNISAADAKGAQGIADAAAALAEAKAKVASVTGDADVAAATSATYPYAVTLSLNKATTVTEGDTKAVTSGAVFDALCWVEFE